MVNPDVDSYAKTLITGK